MLELTRPVLYLSEVYPKLFELKSEFMYMYMYFKYLHLRLSMYMYVY